MSLDSMLRREKSKRRAGGAPPDSRSTEARMHDATATAPIQTPVTPAKLPPTYRSVVLDRTGGPEVLHLATLPTPRPGPGEVLVRVAAAGVAFAQVMMRHGTYSYAPPFPFTPGAEVVGDVVAVGPDVSGWRVGDRVAAFSSIG